MHRLANALLVIPLLLAPQAGPPGMVKTCTAIDRATGNCGVTNDGTSITIGGQKTTPGADPGTTTPIGNDIPEGDAGPPPREFDFETCMRSWSFIDCYRRAEEAAPVDEEDDPGLPPITIADLAQFTPAPSLLAGEPDNVGIAGMPTNFVATASVTTQSGSLFGFPVTVRFTPASFEFHYGDGSSATTTTGGSSWEALGQAQFTPTATSHAYAERGTYNADVDVRYTAEVDFGVGWFPVAGQLIADGPAQEIRIFEAHTALVAYTCDQKPSSAGC